MESSIWDMFGLLKILDDVKHLKRTGWLRYNIGEPETVASHMYRMAMLAMVLDDSGFDRAKCIRMALVHDLSEAIVGDITPFCGISSEQKHHLENEIEEPETVASHMYRMAMLAMVLDDSGFDRAKCIRMALVHDLSEAIVGDITPFCGISSEQKHHLENEAMKKIVQMVPAATGSDWYSLWREYEMNATKEAMIVKHLDKFDMIAQAFHYEQKYNIGKAHFIDIYYISDLEEFFTSTENLFTLEPFVTWNRELRAKRSQSKAAANSPVTLMANDADSVS
ncbi:unnamed protein product [Gongylonema pulchrum]|uniref:5'-deoxynucleotidase HDDC2 n=1 Tax=Gongylonema pulchrum TaxID=637853 RepID=A0A183DSF5_9BILA|nr:unnamed protein product [Gongylonema pulchrum]